MRFKIPISPRQKKNIIQTVACHAKKTLKSDENGKKVSYPFPAANKVE